MLDLLIDKIKNYDNPKKYLINQGDYYFEEFENGLSMSISGSIIFFRNDGRVFRLSQMQKYSDIEWKMHHELNDVLSKEKNCRIEIPIDRKTIKVDTINYHYLEVQRPGYTLGLSIFDEYENNNVDQQYFLDYIDDVTFTLDRLMIILNKNNYFCVPSESLALHKRNKDDAGFFWIDFKYWSVTMDQFIEKKIKNMYKTLLSFNDIPVDYKLVMNKAEKSWNKYR